MAFRTIAGRLGSSEGPFVIIHMTGGAGVVGQRRHQARRMAFAAIHRRVFPLQPEVSQVVIKVVGINTSEGLLIVAIHALVPKFTLVDILVAGIALVWTNAHPVLKDAGRLGVHFVAGGAIDPLVRSFQREMGLVVIESFYLA